MTDNRDKLFTKNIGYSKNGKNKEQQTRRKYERKTFNSSIQCNYSTRATSLGLPERDRFRNAIKKRDRISKDTECYKPLFIIMN